MKRAFSPQCAASPGDDGQLLDRGRGGDQDLHGCGHQGVAGLVLGHHLLLHPDQDAALLLYACHRPQDGVIKVCCAHGTCKS